jgi:hypothetical protein
MGKQKMPIKVQFYNNSKVTVWETGTQMEG